jgi:hypothetical protein
MKFFGSAELQQNHLSQAVIPLDTNFPDSPVVGQIVFTGMVLYICVQITSGLPVWVPLTQQLTAFNYSQTTASAEWVITHPLNTQSVQVQVFNSANQFIIPENITINSNTQVTIDFGNETTGSAVILTGVFDAQAMPNYAFEFYQTTPSTTWSITHNLGRFPVVRVFVGNEEVQPASITFNSINVVTLTFGTAVVGQAKLI